jgi:hypothetical protein
MAEYTSHPASCRWMGEPRFTVGGIKELFAQRMYPMRVAVWPASVPAPDAEVPAKERVSAMTATPYSCLLNLYTVVASCSYWMQILPWLVVRSCPSELLNSFRLLSEQLLMVCPVTCRAMCAMDQWTLQPRHLAPQTLSFHWLMVLGV